MIIVLLAVLGLIFGSFVNATVWRLHEQDKVRNKKGKLNKKRLDELSILRGRSMCSNCGHELAAKDLVPFFSWLYLRGRCRYCGVKIQDNPLVEVSTGLLFVLSYIFWPLTLQGVDLLQFIVWLAFLVGFMLLTVYDLRWFLLPNKVVFPLIGLAAAEVVTVAILKHDFWFALHAALGALVLSGIFWVLFQISGGNWIGGGDVKLAIVLGLLGGTVLQAVLVLFFASVIGTLCSIPILLGGKNGLKAKVPFGPYLLAATVVVVLLGPRIVDWYSQILINN